MNFNYQKEQLINFYKELIYNFINELSLDKKELKKFINKAIDNISFTEADYCNIKKEVLNKLLNNKYSLQLNKIETIIKILTNKDTNIKIDYKIQDIDPAIYYFKDDNLYLINNDSIENKWYLSLIDKNSLELIKEIHTDSYENFIEYLKN